MTEDTKKVNMPHPTEALGIPVMRELANMHKEDNRSRGFNKSKDYAQDSHTRGEKERMSNLPPRNPHKVPREALGERIRQRVKKGMNTENASSF
jgi:hypothetical protein